MTTAAARTAETLDMLFGSPLDVISWSLRSMLTAAPGNELLAADFANIEGRVLAWLADEQWKLQAFRDYDAGQGPDLYKVTAAAILDKAIGDITDEERQASGKVPELACGYQGGVGAFQNMAKIYGVSISDQRAEEIKDGWRARHSNTVNYWYGLDRGAKDALRNQGAKVSVGAEGRAVTFRVAGSFMWCRLPSGRVLCYPYARLDTGLTYLLPGDDGGRRKLSARAVSQLKDGIPDDWVLEREDSDVIFYMTVDGTSNKWVETDTYGGKLTENIDQAISRDLLAAAMLRAEAAGYPVVLHVHDEVVSEVAAGFGDLKEFERLCAQTPAWAAGLPVAAAGWRGKRYRK